MDEHKLGELFREAARTVPPPSFDEHDVARAARRVTARRRVAAASGALTVAVLLVGGIGAGTGMFGGSGSTPVAAPNSQTSTVPSARAGAQRLGPSMLLEPGTCGPPDPVLASALAGRLPTAAGISPVSARGGCAPGSRNAAFELRDGASAGSVAVILGRAETPPEAQPGTAELSDGTRQVMSRTRSGQVLLVLSTPDAGSPTAVYADRLGSIASDLDQRF
jgi:hypothetical protein